METFGKTGVRRIVPGEFLGCDPKGRAVMIGAVEKQKFVYILSRDGQNKLTISSPLEAHKAHVVTVDLCGLDVGDDNPQFACLEMDYGEADSSYAPCVTGDKQLSLTVYEMDLGLNHVTRKYLLPVDQTARLLIPVASEPVGPGGVFVVQGENIVYKKKDHEDRVCKLPKRYF